MTIEEQKNALAKYGEYSVEDLTKIKDEIEKKISRMTLIYNLNQLIDEKDAVNFAIENKKNGTK